MDQHQVAGQRIARVPGEQLEKRRIAADVDATASQQHVEAQPLVPLRSKTLLEHLLGAVAILLRHLRRQQLQGLVAFQMLVAGVFPGIERLLGIKPESAVDVLPVAQRQWEHHQARQIGLQVGLGRRDRGQRLAGDFLAGGVEELLGATPIVSFPGERLARGHLDIVALGQSAVRGEDQMNA